MKINNALIQKILKTILSLVILSIAITPCTYAQNNVIPQILHSSWHISSEHVDIELFGPQDGVVTDYRIIYTGDLPKELENLGDWRIIRQEKNCAVHELKSENNLPEEEFFTNDSNSKTFCESEDESIETAKKIMRQSQEVNSIKTEELIPVLAKADNIVFHLGSGIIANHGWTLIQFHEKLGLKNNILTNMVTDESMFEFLPKFIKNPENYYPIMSTFLKFVFVNSDVPTKAHYALKDMIDILKKQGKNVTFYTGNFNKLSDKVGIIETDEQKTDDEIRKILLDSTNSKSVVIIAMGLRGDHGAVMSQYKTAFPQAQIFSFNLRPTKMIKFKINVDIAEGIHDGLLDINGHVLGDLQETLPALRDELRKQIDTKP